MEQSSNILAGVKALVVVLGVHGGGVANAKWLLRHGAKVTVTDERTKEILAHSLKQFTLAERREIKFVLGGQREQDFQDADLIILGPGVDKYGKWAKLARQLGKRIENDASLFFRYTTNPVIAVTGTRGKTTTTQWIASLLHKRYPLVRASGNTPENAFLKEFNRVNGKDIPVVAEMSSWQLEHLASAGRAPHVSVITNLYPDHLNRYKGIKDYANAKANIFATQKADDFLVLNYDNEWTTYFLKKKPKALLFFISKTPLPKGKNGLYLCADYLTFRFDGVEQKLFSVKKFITSQGAHNLENLMNAVLAVKLFDSSVTVSEQDALKLASPKMRQEVVYKMGRLTVINDSCATSPDGTIAALQRFSQFGSLASKLVLVAGGTDKMLEFGALAKIIKKILPEQDVILLDGSGTRKLHEELRSFNPKTYDTLRECFTHAVEIMRGYKKGKVTLLFSPGAASFEKFLHEFDRGEQFNKLIKKYYK